MAAPPPFLDARALPPSTSAPLRTGAVARGRAGPGAGPGPGMGPGMAASAVVAEGALPGWCGGLTATVLGRVAPDPSPAEGAHGAGDDVAYGSDAAYGSEDEGDDNEDDAADDDDDDDSEAASVCETDNTYAAVTDDSDDDDDDADDDDDDTDDSAAAGGADADADAAGGPAAATVAAAGATQARGNETRTVRAAPSPTAAASLAACASLDECASSGCRAAGNGIGAALPRPLVWAPLDRSSDLGKSSHIRR